MRANGAGRVANSRATGKHSSMCGRIGLSKPARSDWLDGLLSNILREPNYNLKPTESLPLIRRTRDGETVAELARWGLIPAWAKKPPKFTFNARGETVATLNSFKGSFAKRRGLIPTDFFYEWQDLGKGVKKQPYLIERADGETLVFAGLWEYDHDGLPMSATIVTTTPNDVMSKIHNRMPVILEPENWQRWLNAETPIEVVKSLITPAADGILQVTPVSTLVNTGVNAADCMAPIELK
ncbi:MAG: SOS response-associated peptidase [Gemmatimonadaceae bacterium]